MKQGIKKFTAETQGARTKEGQLRGDDFIRLILKTLNISEISYSFKPKYDFIQQRMYPDFVVRKNGTDYLILLESKYKQIPGSDWEKLESNWGYHEYFYNEICGVKCKTIVILTGYWRRCQHKIYDILLYYIKKKYGENSIFDFGDNVSEIYRFAEYMGIKLSDYKKNYLKILWEEEQK